MTHADESKSADKRLSDDLQVLETEAAELTLQRDNTIKEIRDLREAEDTKNGVYFHKEIFEAQQKKLRLDVEIKFRTNKINRINMGIDEMDASDGVKNGFLF